MMIWFTQTNGLKIALRPSAVLGVAEAALNAPEHPQSILLLSTTRGVGVTVGPDEAVKYVEDNSPLPVRVIVSSPLQ